MPSRGGKEITLLDLATHTSGLPFDAGLDESPNAPGGNPFHRLTNEKLYAFLSSLTLGRDPGAAYSYSNVGMALLAHAIERRAGVSYEKLVLDRICRPLGMNNTRITLTPQLKSRLATGHDQAGKCVPYWDIGAYAGAGAIRSTANDLLKYVSANLGIKQSRLTPLMQSTHEVRHTNSPGPIEGENHRNTGMAWTDLGIYQPPGMQIIGHPGGAGGYSAFIGMDKKQRRGAVVLVNQFQGRLNPSVVGCAILQRVGLTKDTTTALVLELAGVGAALATDEKTRLVRITKVYNDTPAAKAGLTEGQLISRIDNTPTTGKTVAECAGLIRGPVGTKVRLELTDPEGKGTKIVEITRHKFVTTG
jgi:CubicO group peptidase (beta-lactamase class C family)